MVLRVRESVLFCDATSFRLRDTRISINTMPVILARFTDSHVSSSATDRRTELMEVMRKCYLTFSLQDSVKRCMSNER
jgi:hypothetical protein